MTDVGDPTAGLHLGDAGLEAGLGHGDELAALLVDLAHRGSEGGVAVPAVDDRPAVDGDDVALLEAVRAGYAVDDHVVG